MPTGHKRGETSFVACGGQSREVRRSSSPIIGSPFLAFSGRYLHVLIMTLAVFVGLRPAWAQVNLSPAEPRATPPVQVPTFPARPPDIDIPLPEQLAPEGIFDLAQAAHNFFLDLRVGHTRADGVGRNPARGKLGGQLADV